MGRIPWRAVASAAALAVLAGSTASGRAEPAPPPTEWASPYVAAFDGQTPEPPPFHPPRNAGEEATRAKFRKTYKSGVRWSYTWIPWSYVEKTPGVYSFEDLDNYVSWARAEGILLKLQVMTGGWSLPQPQSFPLRTNPDRPGLPNVPGVDLTPAVDYWAALVKRYKPGGDLARSKGWKDGYGVRRWELENEPATLPWWGTWGKVPKDFAAFAAAVSRRVRTIDPKIELSGPALAQGEDAASGCVEVANCQLDGLPWLREALSTKPSEWSSTTFRESAEKPALGPFLDAFSWHFDNANLSDGSVQARHKGIRDLVDSFANQPKYPTRKGVPLWYSEGSALAYNTDNAKFATAQVQLMTLLLATGTTTMNLEPGTQINDSVGQWETLPMYGAQRTLTTYLPRAGEVRANPPGFDPAKVVSYLRTDPRTGLRTYVVWAKNAPGAGTPGPEFALSVPVRTGRAEVVTSDGWAKKAVAAAGGKVSVMLQPNDPSRVVFVAERGTVPRGKRNAAAVAVAPLALFAWRRRDVG